MSESFHDFPEWLHGELVQHFALEREAWALDRVSRVQERLNTYRPTRTPLEMTILWLPQPIAFTTAGRYIYISRRILERLPTDDALAFIFAHEAAHHDLGHLDLFTGWAKWIPESEATAYVAALARLVEHHRYGPAREAAADEYAIRLCLAAGYNGPAVVHALEVLEALFLDAGDLSGVYGPENLLDPTDPSHDSTAEKIQRWLWEHLKGYQPLDERLRNARALLPRRAAPGAAT